MNSEEIKRRRERSRFPSYTRFIKKKKKEKSTSFFCRQERKRGKDPIVPRDFEGGRGGLSCPGKGSPLLCRGGKGIFRGGVLNREKIFLWKKGPRLKGHLLRGEIGETKGNAQERQGATPGREGL